MKRKKYASDISREKFAEIEPLLRSVRRATKPTTVDLYEVFRAVLYLLRTEVAMTFRLRGGKTAMVLPDGTRAVQQREATVDNTMIKVIARGFRWHKLLYERIYATIEDLAEGEKINPSYVSRVMRLAYLSPAIVETIVEGKQSAYLTMKDLLGPFPVDWGEQEGHFLGASGNAIT